MTFYEGSSPPGVSGCKIGDIFHHKDTLGSMGYFRVQCELSLGGHWHQQWIRMHLIKEFV